LADNILKVSRIVSLVISILTLYQLIAGLNLELLDAFRVDLMAFECVSTKSNYCYGNMSLNFGNRLLYFVVAAIKNSQERTVK